MRRRITKVDLMSAARVLGILAFVQGFVLGLISLGLKVTGMELPLPIPAYPGATTITLLLWTPLSFGALGVISGAVLALIYNWIAKRFGGIEYEMEKSV